MLLGANRKRNLVYTFFLTLNFKDRIEATNSDSPGQVLQPMENRGATEI